MDEIKFDFFDGCLLTLCILVGLFSNVIITCCTIILVCVLDVLRKICEIDSNFLPLVISTAVLGVIVTVIDFILLPVTVSENFLASFIIIVVGYNLLRFVMNYIFCILCKTGRIKLKEMSYVNLVRGDYLVERFSSTDFYAKLYFLTIFAFFIIFVVALIISYSTYRDASIENVFAEFVISVPLLFSYLMKNTGFVAEDEPVNKPRLWYLRMGERKLKDISNNIIDIEEMNFATVEQLEDEIRNRFAKDDIYRAVDFYMKNTGVDRKTARAKVKRILK